MLLYFIGSILLILTICFIFVRLKYRFWAAQPVYHFYDVYYWFVNVGIIRHELPEKNRYTNFQEIETISSDKVTDVKLRDFTDLIQLNYLRNHENTFIPEKDNIMPYFEGHNSPAFFSFFWQPDVLLDVKTNRTIDTKTLIGAMTSRPLNVTIYNTNQDIQFSVFYVDYLCVKKGFRKRNIAPQLIQTHEYNQCHMNPNISVSLFKREGELTGIVPLTVFQTYCFDMKNWILEPEPLHSKVTLLVGDSQNMFYLYNFINEKQKKWDITIIPELSNLMKLIESKNMFIMMLLIEDNIEAVYIFRKSCADIEKGKEALICIASMNGDALSSKEFVQGFKVSLWKLLEKEKQHYKFLIVEDTIDNGHIIDNIRIRTYPYAISPTAYFFYNFVYSPFKNNRTFIVN